MTLKDNNTNNSPNGPVTDRWPISIFPQVLSSSYPLSPPPLHFKSVRESDVVGDVEDYESDEKHGA